MTKKSDRVIYVCSHCGSSDVTNDGLLRWSVKNQCWEVAGDLDNCDCEECGGECSLTKIILSAGETYDRFAYVWRCDRFVVERQSRRKFFVYHYGPDTLRGDADFIDEADNAEDAFRIALTKSDSICGAHVIDAEIAA